MFDTARYDGRMPYRRCGDSGLLLPAISLGLWHNFGAVDDFEEARRMMRRAFDRGITHFDLANNYGPPPGSAEEIAGRILVSDFICHRDELVISTKAGHEMWNGPYGMNGSRKHLLASLDQSLKRLRLNYVDIFYSHCSDPDTRLEETMSALATAVHSGRAIYAGLSKYPLKRLKKAVKILTRHGRALPDLSAAVFHPPARRGNRRHPRLAARRGHRLHRLQSAGPGHAHAEIPRRHPRRITRRETARASSRPSRSRPGTSKSARSATSPPPTACRSTISPSAGRCARRPSPRH